MSALNGQRHLNSGSFLILVILLGAFGPISTDMFLPALPDMVTEFGTTAAIMNMVLYGFMFAMAIAIFLLGPITDKYGRRMPLILSLAEYTVTTLLCAFVHSVETLIFLRVLQAIGAGAAMTLSVAFVKDCYQGTVRLKVLNIVAIVGVLGPLLAPIIGSGMIAAWGWRSTFIAPAAVSLICLILSLLLDETLPKEERITGGIRESMSGMKKLCRNPPFLIFAIMTCLFNMPFMAYLSVSSYIYEDMFGLGQTIYSVLLAATLIIGTVAMIIINKLTKNTPSRRKVLLFPVIGAVSTISMFLIGDVGWYAFFVCFAICMFSTMTVRPWGLGILMASHDGDSGAVSSLSNFVFFMIGCAGMILSTLPWKDYVFGIAALIAMSTVIYIVLWAVFVKRGMDLKGFDLPSEAREKQ